MKKNDLISLEINDVTIEGVGIGRFENKVIFVQNAAIGDKLEVKIIKINKNYAVGKIEKIIFPSKDRKDSDCQCYLKCGGCSFRHINYQAELKIKHKHICDCLKRIGGFSDLEVKDIISCENTNFYRNKSQMPVGKSEKIVAGFFSPRSHRIVDCSDCLLHKKEFNEIIKIIKVWIENYKISVYNEKLSSGLIRHIYLRCAEKTGEILVCIVINGNDLPFKNQLIEILTKNFKNICGIVLNINKEKTNVILGEKQVNIYGKSYITDILCGLKFNISPLSFYQINRSQTEKLYNIVNKELDLKEKSLILDLYCGIGTISIFMASFNHEVIGVEIVKEAVENAKENAKINDIKNTKFFCSDAAEITKKIKKYPDAIIIDPPRKGCSLKLINDILKINPEKIAYVSCNPATLARDIKIICQNSNFKIKSITPVDMFPKTSHVETVVLMSKVNPNK